MPKKGKSLKEAESQTRRIIETIRENNPDSRQWDYEMMKRRLENTYEALKRAWLDGKSPDCIRPYFSDEGYRLLKENCKLAHVDIQYFDLLDCFDAETHDLAIIGASYFLAQDESFFVAWINDNQDLDKSREEIKNSSFSIDSNFLYFNSENKNQSVSSAFRTFGEKLELDPIRIQFIPKDCWTFKWSKEEEQWLLHSIAFDNSSNYLKVFDDKLNKSSFS